jgi:DNA-binding transcriptional ArsR family regulator
MQTDQLSLTFAALADPTRRSIVTRLAEGEATVNELAEPFTMSLPSACSTARTPRRPRRNGC